MTGSPQISNQLAWEGLVSGSTAVAIGVVIALLTAWSLWRERQSLGTLWAAIFFVLRMVAFGCALWMLAGPTKLRIERTTTQQSVAIFADSSESMEVVDPPDQSDSLRWALAVDGESQKSSVGCCDRLAVALGAALADCKQFAAQVDEHRPPKQLEAIVASITAAVDRASAHAAELSASAREKDSSLTESASRIAALLTGPVGESLVALRSALSASDRIVGEDFQMRVEQLSDAMVSARRRAVALAADLAQHSSDADTRRNEVDGLTRREKAGRTLDSFEHDLGGSLGENVRIRRFRFDRTPAPVGVEAGWTKALAQLPPPESSNPLQQVAAENAAADANGGANSETNLSAVLQQLAADKSGQSTRLAVVLSDGRHNDADAPSPQDVAAQLTHLPVYVVPIGNAVQVRDLLLHRVEAPSVVAEKDSAVIDVIVTGFDCDGESTAVVLRHEGREIDRKPIQFEGNHGDIRVRFMVPATTLGWQEYVVEAEPLHEEANTANNYLPVSFEVVRERLRVLLADGVARWEYRYLNQLFRRDQHVVFDDLLFYPRVQGSGSLADHPVLPRTLDEWAKYDVVILGDIGPRQFSKESQQSLLEYVKSRGGNVIIVAGHDAMPGAYANQPLIDLLPVEPMPVVDAQQGYSLNLTEEGRFNSALLIDDSASESLETWQKTYQRFPVFELSDYSHPKETARTLIQALPNSAGIVKSDSGSGPVDRAFLCWQRLGAGRVAYLAAPDTYRLRWRRGDRMHHRFWGQFLRWITAANAGAGTDLVRLQTDRTNYAQGEPVEVTVWLKDASGRPLAGESIQVEARTFNNEAVSAELTPDPDVAGRYTSMLRALSAGAYQIAVHGRVIDTLAPADGDANQSQARATITVRAADSIELANTQCNRALLEQVAQMTGGQVIPPTAIGEVLQLVSFTPEVSERVERMPLWNRWSNMWIMLGCLFTEWMVRKGKGLV